MLCYAMLCYVHGEMWCLCVLHSPRNWLLKGVAGPDGKCRNDSMSFVDVRDCAAQHVAAMELEKEGRFMSFWMEKKGNPHEDSWFNGIKWELIGFSWILWWKFIGIDIKIIKYPPVV